MPHLAVEPLEPRETPTTLPTGFAEAVVANGLNEPTAMAVAPDGRVFVAEQGGALRVVADGQLQPAPVLSLTVDSTGERGLLGVALDPAFETNNRVYVYYTVPAAGPTPAFNRISRFTNGTEEVLVNLDPFSATNHNGGAIAFGPDGKLYVGVGENANPPNSQSLATRLGKILRYNPDGSIPADNPTSFAGVGGTTAGANRAIWAVGLRNPFTLAVHPTTGRVVVNDVGQNAFEEVDEGAAGRNFGWPATEGDFDQAAFPDFTRPLFGYPHGSGNDAGFTVAGAAFYSPATQAFPADYAGDYFFGDFVNKWVKRYDSATGTAADFATDLTTGGLVGLAVTPGGELLALARGNGGPADGVLSRITYADPNPPVPPIPPVPAPPPVVVGGAGVRALGTTTGAERARYAGFPADTRVASGDVTGDGIPDVIAGGGPGSAPGVVVYSGRDGSVVATLSPFEAAFTGGVFVTAGDLDADGKADVIVSPDQGGGPRVTVFRAADRAVLANFFGIEDPAFRGGARVAAGDVTGDGRIDLVVSAGFGGGPRIAGWDGAALLAGRFVHPFADFFAFENTLRNGAFVAAGDVNADGRADLLFGGGPGGGPRVRVLSGADPRTVLADFFAGDSAARDGVRVAAKDLEGDGRADVVAGVGDRVRGYLRTALVVGGTPTPFVDYPGGVGDGVYVG